VHRLLLTRQWAVRLVAGLVLVAACVMLGMWQLDRNDERKTRNAVIEANTAAPTVPIDAVAPPGTPVPDSLEWTPVSVTGTYDLDNQLLLRLRPVAGERGVHILTPLVTSNGSAVLVNRGFLPGRDRAEVEPPHPPAGTVTVSGRLHPSETGRGVTGNLDAGTIRYIDIDEIAAGRDLRLYGGWLAALEENPSASVPLIPLPEPEVESGPHLSYAIQWFLFAIIGVGGFIFLVRAESKAAARDRSAEPTQLQRHGHEN
jgi:cytochrome oxidase assembly protein ShyY1